MFSGEQDVSNCFLDINAGSGGTEAQDWAQMLFRMYCRYGERKGFKVEVQDESEGDVAGLKAPRSRFPATMPTAIWRTETGIHRLFARVHSTATRAGILVCIGVRLPEVDDSIEIDINPADVRTDTFRASGAGGQHINKTDSAVRLTHILTGIVVQCQDGRSQHTNRDVAWKRLRSRLYEHELRKRMEAQQTGRHPRATSAGATRSAATCLTSRVSRICVPATKSAIPVPCLTAISTASSRHR